LLKNAMEAIPGGGTIQVNTRMLSNAPQHPGDKNEAGRIKISVCDNGPGIEEDIKNDLFKMNVTSKTGHDGLGLPIVLEAVTHPSMAHCCATVPPGRGPVFTSNCLQATMDLKSGCTEPSDLGAFHGEPPANFNLR
jgi:K+-sensing histidine kinase KdpD